MRIGVKYCDEVLTGESIFIYERKLLKVFLRITNEFGFIEYNQEREVKKIDKSICLLLLSNALRPWEISSDYCDKNNFMKNFMQKVSKELNILD